MLRTRLLISIPIVMVSFFAALEGAAEENTLPASQENASLAAKPKLSPKDLKEIEYIAKAQGVDIPESYMSNYVKEHPFDDEQIEILRRAVTQFAGKFAPKPYYAKATAPHTYWSASSGDPPCGSPVNGAVFPPGYSVCVRACVDVPKSKKITEVKMFRTDLYFGLSQCTNGGDCGWSRWWSTPEYYPKDNVVTVCGNFKNWSNNIERIGILEVDVE